MTRSLADKAAGTIPVARIQTVSLKTTQEANIRQWCRAVALFVASRATSQAFEIQTIVGGTEIRGTRAVAVEIGRGSKVGSRRCIDVCRISILQLHQHFTVFLQLLHALRAKFRSMSTRIAIMTFSFVRSRFCAIARQMASLVAIIATKIVYSSLFVAL